MKYFFVIILLHYTIITFGQIENPKINIRGSFLLFPFTPLLTVETKMIGKLTIQAETNFKNTHGTNLKWFTNEPMNKGYIFSGIAFVKNSELRKDKSYTLLPYTGYGFAYQFGKNKRWIWDSRCGLGATLNADKNIIVPVIKTGWGKLF